MIYVAYNVVTGALLDISEAPIAVDGYPLTATALDRNMPDLTMEYWSRSLADFMAKPGGRWVTKLELVERLGGDFKKIIKASRTNDDVEVFVRMMELAAPKADGKSIHLDDPRTITALQMFEAAGIIATGRAAEILS